MTEPERDEPPPPPPPPPPPMPDTEPEWRHDRSDYGRDRERITIDPTDLTAER